MDDTPRLAPTDPTIEATPDSASLETSSRRSSVRCVDFVEGSGPHLSCETESLLRHRLRIASLTLLAAGAVFLPFRLLTADLSRHPEQIMLILHVGLLAVLGVLAFSLCRKCEATLRVLRVKELLVFGLPAIYFISMQSISLCDCAADHGMMHSPVPPWFVLMFTYAMFIPNTIRRAGIVLGCMAATPLLLIGVLWATDAHAAGVLASEKLLLVEWAMLLGIGAAIGTFGAHTIGLLRRKEFRSRQYGQYKLTERIGEGGMGEVFLAEHQMMKRPCAVKLIHPDKAGDPKVLARFEREVRAMAKLSHWNTVEIFDYGRTDDGTFYYVMEYLPGLSLSEMVKRFGPLPPQRAVFFLQQICEALEEAHDMGLLHRDIKPGNVFAAERGGQHDVAKLLDFGLVKPLAESNDSQLTQEGTITGSPLYMSPEQATGDNKVDERSDIYALGAVAYYLVTGRPPFEGEKAIQVIIAHAKEKVTPPSEIEPKVPADLEHVILRCLAKDPRDRYESVGDLRDALSIVECAGDWSRDLAAAWWRNLPQPQQREQAVATV